MWSVVIALNVYYAGHVNNYMYILRPYRVVTIVTNSVIKPI